MASIGNLYRFDKNDKQFTTSELNSTHIFVGNRTLFRESFQPFLKGTRIFPVMIVFEGRVFTMAPSAD